MGTPRKVALIAHDKKKLDLISFAKDHAQLLSHFELIATGTTVVRALETVTDPRGVVHPGRGVTDTVVTPLTGLRAVDGLLTGWHEPEASHLLMLEAVAGRELLALSYAASLAEGYLWHEVGDLHLILP